MVDPLLAYFIALVNNDNLRGLPILLTYGGSQVHGTAISPRLYGELLGQDLGDKMTDEAGEIVMRTVGSELESLPFEGYVHLRDAKILLSGEAVIDVPGSGLWRGRLDTIDGWARGQTLLVEEPDE
jgi:hypothetical protein